VNTPGRRPDQLWAEPIARSAFTLGRILKGANHTDLPVQQPTPFELNAFGATVARALTRY
jgi:hypothetical protein